MKKAVGKVGEAQGIPRVLTPFTDVRSIRTYSLWSTIQTEEGTTHGSPGISPTHLAAHGMAALSQTFWLHLRRAIPRGLAECSSRRDGGKWNVDGSDCMINGGPTIIRRENGWHSISIGIERAWDPFYADTWVPAHQTVHCPAQKLPINANWAVVNQLVSLEVIFIEFVESYTDASRQVQSCSLSKHVALMPRAFSSCHSVSKLRAEYSISHNM